MKLFKLVCGTDKEQSVYIYATSISRQSVFDCQLFSAWEYFLLVVCHGSCWMRWQLDYPWQGRDETPGLLIPQNKEYFDKPKRVAAHIIRLFKYQFLGMNAESRLFRWKKSSFDLPHGPPLNKLFWRQFTQKKGAYNNVTNAIHFDMKIEPLQWRPCISDCCLPSVWDVVCNFDHD